MVINMDLESTIVTINNLLKLDFESSFSDFIQSQKQLTYAKKHSHIEIICQHIMKTNGYGELLTAYNNNEPRADVLNFSNGKSK